MLIRAEPRPARLKDNVLFYQPWLGGDDDDDVVDDDDDGDYMQGFSVLLLIIDK